MQEGKRMSSWKCERGAKELKSLRVECGVWGGVEREPMPRGVNEHDVLDLDVDSSAAVWSSGLLGRDAVCCNNDGIIVVKLKIQGSWVTVKRSQRKEGLGKGLGWGKEVMT